MRFFLVKKIGISLNHVHFVVQTNRHKEALVSHFLIVAILYYMLYVVIFLKQAETYPNRTFSPHSYKNGEHPSPCP